NDAATGRRSTSAEAMYGRFASRTSNGKETTGGSRSSSMNRTRSATPCPTAFSRATSSASAETSVPRISTSPRVRRRRSVADNDLRVGEQRGLVGADGFREQQLGVESRTLRPAGAQALDAVPQELFDGGHKTLAGVSRRHLRGPPVAQPDRS